MSHDAAGVVGGGSPASGEGNGQGNGRQCQPKPDRGRHQIIPNPTTLFPSMRTLSPASPGAQSPQLLQHRHLTVSNNLVTERLYTQITYGVGLTSAESRSLLPSTRTAGRLTGSQFGLFAERNVRRPS